MAIVILSYLPALAASAVGFPPVKAVSGDGLASGSTPAKPLESGAPPIPPSLIDPGIQHIPEKRGDSRAAVKPPNLDSGMSMNPDVAPPAPKGINPSGRSTPPGKPDVR